MTHRKAPAPTHLLPWRFGVFLALMATSAGFALLLPPPQAILLGFDVAALTFIATLAPLFRHDPLTMRKTAVENDANRGLILLLTAIVMLVILIAIALEVMQRKAPGGGAIALVIATLLIAWLFSNLIYAMHYAHIFYLPGDRKSGAKGGRSDAGGVVFPDTPEPDCRDFTYFAFTLGMTFQTSDVDITSRYVRWIVTLHSLAAFVFNLGILAFTINILGSS